MVELLTAIGPEDVSAIKVICRKRGCHSSLLLRPNKRPKHDLKCPICQYVLWNADDPEYQLAVALAELQRDHDENNHDATRIKIVIKEEIKES